MTLCHAILKPSRKLLLPRESRCDHVYVSYFGIVCNLDWCIFVAKRGFFFLVLVLFWGGCRYIGQIETCKFV